MKYFGTDGIRFLVDAKLNESLIIRLGEYFSLKRHKLLIASDTRESRFYLKSLFLVGALKNNEVVDIGIATSPSLSYLVKHHDFDYGIMFSASHNPASYNGIKIFDHDGYKINHKEAQKIEKFISKKRKVLYKNGSYLENSSLIDEYITFLCEQINEESKNQKIAFDCANGASAIIMQKIKERIHPSWDLFYTKGIINQRCGATNLSSLQKIVTKSNYAYGVAFDGDGDRIMMIQNKRIIDGDDILTYFALHLHKDCVLTTLSGKDIKTQLENHHLKYELVPVGDQNIASKIKDNLSLIGGETSGHIIISPNHITGDGIYVALTLLSNIYKEKEKEPFIKRNTYYQTLNVPKKSEMLEKNYLKRLSKRFYLSGNQDIHIQYRFSKTEDVLRIIFEANSKNKLKQAKKLMNSILLERI